MEVIMNNENVMTNTAPNANKIIRYAILGVIALVALALVISIITALIPAKFETRDDNTITWKVNDDDQMVFLFNGKKVVELSDDLSEEMNANSIQTDYNQSYAVFVTNNDDEDSKGGTLYVVNSKKAVKVKDEVTDVVLSTFGSSFLFISDGDLYYGQLKNPTKAAKVDKDVSDITSVSPNGKSFAYEKVDDEKDEVKTEYYISTNGKKGEKFGKKNADIVNISDGAKYVYYTKEAKLYANDTKICDLEDFAGMAMIFNRDGSQMVYSAKNDKGDVKTYLIAKAKDKNAVAGGSLYGIICPEGAANVTYNGAICVYYNTSTLAKCALGVSDEEDVQYYYLKNTKGKSEKISAMKNADDIQMLEDGETVLYTKNGNLRQIKVNKPNSDPKEYTGADEDISSFKATADGKAIYVKDTDGTLYYVKSASKMKKIEEDINSYYVTDSGAVYFVNEDEELHYANKSDSSKRVVSDVTDVSYDALSGVMTVEADDVFGTVEGKKFKKLFSVD
jgi:hypothetical protein